MVGKMLLVKKKTVENNVKQKVQNMELQIISRQDAVPAFDPQAIKVKYIDYPGYDGKDEEEDITETLISKVLNQIPKGINAYLSLDPYGEDDWMEVICDGEWLALGYSSDGGCDNYYSYNPDFAGTEELTPLLSGGQSTIEKYLTVKNMEEGIKAVEYFIRTGELYPGIEWAKQL